MLMHTRGILVMTPASAMVLTGKQALDFSGGVSAEDNFGIGGYDRIMGPNGQAPVLGAHPRRRVPTSCCATTTTRTWCPGERLPRRRATTDPVDRDVRSAPTPRSRAATSRLVGRHLLGRRTTPSARSRSTCGR